MHRTGPSESERRKAVEERVRELRREGKSTREVAIVLDGEAYKRNETSRALKVNPRVLNTWIRGDSGGRDAGTFSGPVTAKVDSEGQREEKKESKYEPQSDISSILNTHLRTISGVNRSLVGPVLAEIDTHPEYYENNPLQIYPLLTGAGLSNQRAFVASERVIRDLKPEALPGLVALFEKQAHKDGHNEADSGDWMNEYMQKEMEIDQVLRLRTAGQGSGQDVAVLQLLKEMREEQRRAKEEERADRRIKEMEGRHGRN